MEGLLMIRLMSRCNEKCLFCMVADEIARSDDVVFREAVARIAAQAPQTQIEFFGGEPTIYPGFLDLLRAARSRGHRCSIATNARIFHSAGFTRSVAELGADRIYVRTSPYGDTEAVHDRYTATRGSYRQTVRGIERIVDAGFPCQVNIVMLRDNVDVLETMVRQVHAWRVPRIKFGMLSGVEGHPEHAVPLVELAPRLRRAVALAEQLGLKVTVEKTPACAIDGRLDLLSTEREVYGGERVHDDDGACLDCRVGRWCDGLDPGHAACFSVAGLRPVRLLPRAALNRRLDDESVPPLLETQCVEIPDSSPDPATLASLARLVDRVRARHGRVAIFPTRFVSGAGTAAEPRLRMTGTARTALRPLPRASHTPRPKRAAAAIGPQSGPSLTVERRSVMPVVRIQKPGEGDEASLASTKSAATGLGVGSGELGRITTNQALADHVGKFVAGEVSTQFRNEALADMLKGKNMIMVSGSWADDIDALARPAAARQRGLRPCPGISREAGSHEVFRQVEGPDRRVAGLPARVPRAHRRRRRPPGIRTPPLRDRAQALLGSLRGEPRPRGAARAALGRGEHAERRDRPGRIARGGPAWSRWRRPWSTNPGRRASSGRAASTCRLHAMSPAPCGRVEELGARVSREFPRSGVLEVDLPPDADLSTFVDVLNADPRIVLVEPAFYGVDDQDVRVSADLGATASRPPTTPCRPAASLIARNLAAHSRAASLVQRPRDPRRRRGRRRHAGHRAPGAGGEVPPARRRRPACARPRPASPSHATNVASVLAAAGAVAGVAPGLRILPVVVNLASQLYAERAEAIHFVADCARSRSVGGVAILEDRHVPRLAHARRHQRRAAGPAGERRRPACRSCSPRATTAAPTRTTCRTTQELAQAPGDGLLSVGALARDDRRAPYSNHSPGTSASARPAGTACRSTSATSCAPTWRASLAFAAALRPSPRSARGGGGGADARRRPHADACSSGTAAAPHAARDVSAANPDDARRCSAPSTPGCIGCGKRRAAGHAAGPSRCRRWTTRRPCRWKRRPRRRPPPSSFRRRWRRTSGSSSSSVPAPAARRAADGDRLVAGRSTARSRRPAA
ncbi:MAG: radical SAM protein [Comamonadaceae bacterium]|nr:radical SAM protein [Comamonadaceae bacterium]